VNLRDELPRLLPLAHEWAREQALFIQRSGRGLTISERKLAAGAGVEQPALVRIAVVDQIPAPTHPLLRTACEQLDFLGRDTVGLTLGYSVYLRKEGSGSRRLLAHELRHAAQYEGYGSIEAYLDVYIRDLVRFGYANAPMELDAQQAEAGRGL